MPELPEVEVIRQGLVPHLVGRTVEEVTCNNKKLRLPVPRNALKHWVRGGKILAVDRRAKYLLIRIHNGAVLVFHLGMSGRLGLFLHKAQKAKHDHLRLTLDNGLELRFNDSRRFGSVQVVMPGEDSEKNLFAFIGPEPLKKGFSYQYLQRKAGNRKQPVKNFLMDSKVVAGIGNIYANEILYNAKIHPGASVFSLDNEHWKEIVRATRMILQKAINSGGSTISDFVNSSGKSGYFQLELEVYGRDGLPCNHCGALIDRIVLAGRATYFCGCCQK